VSIEIARRENVLRIPSAALRFKPSAEALQQLGVVGTPAVKGPTVWVSTGKAVQPIAVKIGAADATYTEVIGGSLVEGATLVTRIAAAGTPVATRPGASGAGNPLMPTAPGRR
jgi:HlyD family secretion protein